MMRKDCGGEPEMQSPLSPKRTPGTRAVLELQSARPDLAAEVGKWLEHLGGERRYSEKTIEAYGRDVHQLLAFLAVHLGKKVSLGGLARLEPRDVRAFLAARRTAGISGRSLMRTLAGARSFARYLERNGKGK